MPGVYEICVKDHFSAAHALKGYNGNCSKIHGHNWMIEICIQCRKLNSIGIGIDFKDVRETLKRTLNKLDHSNLNDLAEFGSINPTSENIGRFLYQELGRCFNTPHIKVSSVKVVETPGCSSTYWED